MEKMALGGGWQWRRIRDSVTAERVAVLSVTAVRVAVLSVTAVRVAVLSMPQPPFIWRLRPKGSQRQYRT